MTKYYRPSVFKGAANRDDNEAKFIEVLNRWHVEYSKGKAGDGYDLLIQIQPMELWEIKNPESVQRGLTKAERAKQVYCNERGIPYRVLEYSDQADEILSAHFTNGGR